MACLKSTKEKQANLFNGDNEEDERKHRGLCDGLEFSVLRSVMWTTAMMRSSCCFSFFPAKGSGINAPLMQASLCEGDEDKRIFLPSSEKRPLHL